MGAARELDRPLPWGARLPFVALLPLAALLQGIASKFPETVESVYSRSVYSAIARGMALLNGWLPFSVAEVLAVSFAAWIVWAVARAARQVRHRRRSVRNVLLHGAAGALAVAGCLYGLGIFLWALNHQRTTSQFGHLMRRGAQIVGTCDVSSFPMLA